MNSIDVESVDAPIVKFEHASGELAQPRMAAPGVGWPAYGIDAAGGLSGRHQDDSTVK